MPVERSVVGPAARKPWSESVAKQVAFVQTSPGEGDPPPSCGKSPLVWMTRSPNSLPPARPVRASPLPRGPSGSRWNERSSRRPVLVDRHVVGSHAMTSGRTAPGGRDGNGASRNSVLWRDTDGRSTRPETVHDRRRGDDGRRVWIGGAKPDGDGARPVDSCSSDSGVTDGCAQLGVNNLVVSSRGWGERQDRVLPHG
jgi:hypothetical protein